jgi:fructan beta-fructosidase
MSNWQYANVVPTKAWRSATTLPREVMLNKKDQIFELKFKPATEIKSIVQNPKSFTGVASLESPLSLIEFTVDAGSQNFMLTLSNDKSEKVIISAADGLFSVDRTTSGITNFSDVFPAINKMDISDVQIRKYKGISGFSIGRDFYKRWRTGDDRDCFSGRLLTITSNCKV